MKRCHDSSHSSSYCDGSSRYGEQTNGERVGRGMTILMLGRLERPPLSKSVVSLIESFDYEAISANSTTVRGGDVE